MLPKSTPEAPKSTLGSLLGALGVFGELSEGFLEALGALGGEYIMYTYTLVFVFAIAPTQLSPNVPGDRLAAGTRDPHAAPFQTGSKTTRTPKPPIQVATV